MSPPLGMRIGRRSLIRNVQLYLLLGPVLAAMAPARSQTDRHAAPWIASLLEQEGSDVGFVRRLQHEVPPVELAKVLLAQPELVPKVMPRFGPALEQGELEIGGYLAACARSLGTALDRRGPPWSAEAIDRMLAVLLVDPARLSERPALRRAVLALLPTMLDPSVSGELRDELLERLNPRPEIDFEASERIELGWGAIPRGSASRRVPYDPVRIELSEPDGPITASVYSLPSSFFNAAEAQRFLTAVESWRPERALLVLVDLPLRRALASGRGARTWLIETHGRAYTPWPRDPLILARRREGGALILERPTSLWWRGEDAAMGRELVQGLPEALDTAWGRVELATAPTSFHNGQILVTEAHCWITIHSVEHRVLELLGLSEVPVASFARGPEIDRYLEAARTAAGELEQLYGRPARFVHARPDSGSAAQRASFMELLGGGAGFDLDSYLTVLPEPEGSELALVADLQAGRELLLRMQAPDWKRLREAYRLVPDPFELRRQLLEYQSDPRSIRLAAFLDQVAEHLRDEGLRVDRLPHLLVPTAMAAEPLDFPDFQITWNNVVIEVGASGRWAEGFSSLLQPGDEQAGRIFGRAGYQLKLLPPLVPSVLHNGGYRCASNHLRATSPGDR